jgi:hypothetical protein
MLVKFQPPLCCEPRLPALSASTYLADLKGLLLLLSRLTRRDMPCSGSFLKMPEAGVDKGSADG